jgi:hypothetical protein
MFRLYITVILGCCLLAAQPTMNHAARSTSKKTLHSMLSKKKKRRAIYIAVGSTVLMAVAVGAGVFLCTTRRPSQQTHANGSGSGSADGETPVEQLVIPTSPAQDAEHPPHTPEGAGLAHTTQQPTTATTHSPGRISRWTGPPVPQDSPAASPRSLGDPNGTTTPDREPSVMRTPRTPIAPSSELDKGRIEETPLTPTGAGCGNISDTPQPSAAAKTKFTRNKEWYCTLSLGADYATNDNDSHRYPNRGNLLTLFEPTNPSNKEQSLHEMKLALELLNPTYQSPPQAKPTQPLHLLLAVQRPHTPFHRDPVPGTPGDPEE